MVNSVTVTSLGGAALLDELRRLAPDRARRGAKRALRAASKEYTKGIQQAIEPARTRGHTSLSVVAGMGDKVWSDKESQFNAKSGYGVGKKKGTYRPSGIFTLTGTTNRYTGSKGIKSKIYERVGRGHQWRSRRVVTKTEQTGNARKFRGRVQKSGAVMRGVAAAGPVAKQKFEAVLNRAIRRAQTRGP